MSNQTIARQLMTVHDVHIVPGRGAALVGTDEDIAGLSHDDLRDVVGSQVELRIPGEASRAVDTLSVEISTSLSGGRNIFILVPEGTVDATAVGGVVWSAR